MKLFRTIPFHPLFLAAYPVIALWAENYYFVEFHEIWRALLVSFASASGLMIVLLLFGVNIHRTGFIVSIAVILFFSYGHVIQLLAKAQLEGKKIIGPAIVTALWPAILVLAVWASMRLIHNHEPIAVFFNVASFSILTLAIFQIVWLGLPNLFRPNVNGYESRDAINLSQPDQGSIPPDIYYIILDGYGRDDMLKKFLDFDNTSFSRQLEKLGFYIADQSISNYSNTTPSIASSLNFGYINQLSTQVGPNTKDYRPLRRLIQENRIETVLKQQGYKTVTFETGFNFTEIPGSDTYIVLQDGANFFESILLTNSLSLLWTYVPLAERYRNRITGTLERLGDLSQIPGPKFVFAHVMAAHPPFVFGPNGETNSQAVRVELDTSDEKNKMKEILAYRDQVTYINKLVINMVSEIQRSSNGQAVIILQGDHGSGVYMDWQSAENTCFTERKSILNAYYFPDQKTGLLYKTITPVNSFRVVLNTYLGGNLPVLEDRSYFSLWESPYNLIDITEQEGNCPIR